MLQYDSKWDRMKRVVKPEKVEFFTYFYTSDLELTITLSKAKLPKDVGIYQIHKPNEYGYISITFWSVAGNHLDTKKIDSLLKNW